MSPALSRLRRIVLAIVVATAAVVVAVLWWRAAHTSMPSMSDHLQPAAGSASRGPSRPRRPASRPIVLSGVESAHDDDAAAGVLSGHVVSDVGSTPIPGARLTFAGAAGLEAVTADADGSFRFAASAPGSYALAEATADGYLPFAPEWGASPVHFEARAGERLSGVLVYLAPAIEYLGEVVDPAGRPVEGASVSVLGAGSQETWTSGPDGAFPFHAADGAVLEATHEGFAPGRATIDFAVQVDKRLKLRLRDAAASGPPGAQVSGVVLSPDGRPFPGAVVTASESARWSGIEGVSDDQGRFTVQVAPGRYLVVASATGFASARLRGVSAPAQDLVLRLSASCGLEGTVRDSTTHAPIAAFTVFVAERLGPLQLDNVAVVSTYDAQGHYRIQGLQEGDYTVEVVAHGYAASGERSVRVGGPTAAPSVVDFALLQGGRVTGKVIESGTGKPLQGARVSLEGTVRSGPSAAPPTASALTNEQGDFTLPGIGSGMQSILVAAEGHHGRLISGIQALAGNDVGPITVELSPTNADEAPHVELAGIGAALSAHGDTLIVVRVIDGGGAAEVGLVPGDAILAVDGRGVVELGFRGSIERIRGPEGSTVQLTVRKTGAEQSATLIVRRRRVRS